jgi:hypothetical protein
MPVELSDDEARELYDVLGYATQHVKGEERAQAALRFDDKPPEYSPLAVRLMAARNLLGERVALLPNPPPTG